MNVIERLFGTKADEIKQDVIITPFLNAAYFARNPQAKPRKTKGFLFEVSTHKTFSVVTTGVGAPFVGDAVMYLKETPCRRLYFIGSCAALAPYDVGDIIVAQKALACESFSHIIQKNIKKSLFIAASHSLSEKFLKFCLAAGDKGNVKTMPKAASIASLGSLSQQEFLLDYLRQQKIGGVDMEVSAFLSAANTIGVPSLAVTYATDTVGEKLFYRTISDDERTAITTARQKTITLVCDFIERHSA